MNPCTVTAIAGGLPEGLAVLASEARSEGYRMLDVLIAEWESGANRFDGPGEAVLGVMAGTVLVGIGGMTVDPDYPDALRMRRFYVSARHRRRGAGSAMARALLERPETQGLLIVLTAGTAAAPAFWESLGFTRAGARTGHTHVLQR